ncbi:hypothetical protein NC652_018189 [Populus alba x Populus x berolinensis]|nr:hypothetical protein NC652_018189 [Populus alba x Populus x berolinensis]
MEAPRTIEHQIGEVHDSIRFGLDTKKRLRPPRHNSIFNARAGGFDREILVNLKLYVLWECISGMEVRLGNYQKDQPATLHQNQPFCFPFELPLKQTPAVIIISALAAGLAFILYSSNFEFIYLYYK